MTNVPPESVTTDCGGDTPRVMKLVRDDDGEIVWRSTHPDRFCRVHAEGEHVAVSCSQCGGTVSVPEPDASTSWEEKIRLFGSSKHTPTCALRRSRHGVAPDDAEDLKSKHQISLSRAKKRAPPPLPSDAGKLRESFPFPPFSVSNGLPNRWPCFSIPLRDCAVSGSPFHPCLRWCEWTWALFKLARSSGVN